MMRIQIATTVEPVLACSPQSFVPSQSGIKSKSSMGSYFCPHTWSSQMTDLNFSFLTLPASTHSVSSSFVPILFLSYSFPIPFLFFFFPFLTYTLTWILSVRIFLSSFLHSIHCHEFKFDTSSPGLVLEWCEQRSNSRNKSYSWDRFITYSIFSDIGWIFVIRERR